MKDMKPYVDSIRAVDVNKYKKISEKSLGKTISDKAACGCAIMMIFSLDDFSDSERAELTMKWIEKFVKAAERESDMRSEMIGTAKKVFATMYSFNCVGEGNTCSNCVFCVCENGVRCRDGHIRKCMCDILKINLNEMEGEDDDENIR